MSSLEKTYKEVILDFFAYNLLIRVGDYLYRNYGFREDTLEATQSYRLAAAQATNITKQAVKNFDLEKRFIETIPTDIKAKRAFNRLSKTKRFRYLCFFAVTAMSSYVLDERSECCHRTKFVCERLLKGLLDDRYTILEFFVYMSCTPVDRVVDHIFDLSIINKTRYTTFALADIYRQLSFADLDFKLI